MQIIDMYSTTLAVYGHEILPRFQIPKTFQHRPDSMLLLMVRQCPRLNTLVYIYVYSAFTYFYLTHLFCRYRLFENVSQQLRSYSLQQKQDRRVCSTSTYVEMPLCFASIGPDVPTGQMHFGSGCADRPGRTSERSRR